MERTDRIDEDVPELLGKEIEFGELVLDLNVKANKLSGKYLKKVFEERNRKEFRGEEVFVTPLEELIVQKKSLGRGKDLEDLERREELEYDRELLALFEKGWNKN